MGSRRRENLTRIYCGLAGKIWDRIETECPKTYWEENFVLGRRRVRKFLLSWMAPFATRCFLDAGCGKGKMAFTLAQEGSTVTAVDLLPRFRTEAATRLTHTLPKFVVGDFCEIFSTLQEKLFHAIVMQEVLEDHPPEERVQVLKWLAESPIPRVYLVFRTKGKADWWLKKILPQGLSETIDPVGLLRWIHLKTPFRLTRQEQVYQRTYRAQVVELTRERTP